MKISSDHKQQRLEKASKNICNHLERGLPPPIKTRYCNQQLIPQTLTNKKLKEIHVITEFIYFIIKSPNNLLTSNA